jgi:hypothetical protein
MLHFFAKTLACLIFVPTKTLQQMHSEKKKFPGIRTTKHKFRQPIFRHPGVIG